MTTTVSKTSYAYIEFMEKVRELGGWIEKEKVVFPTLRAQQKFESWLEDCRA